MQLKTDVTLLFVSAVNNDIFVYQIWTIKLTQSKNGFCVSDRVACTIKMNIKRTFMGNNGFLQKLML